MTNIGAHVVLTQRHGYTDFCRSKPRLVNSVDQGGALLEAKELSGGHTTTIFRTQQVFDDAPGDLLTVTHPMDAVARYWYQEHVWDPNFAPGLRGVWELNPADYYGITNEIGGSDPHSIQRVIDFEWEVTRLANADGYRTALFNASTGTPGDTSLFRTMYVPAIIRAWENGGNIYARHAYQIDEVDLVDEDTGQPYPGNPSRPFEEIVWLRGAGWNGGMALTEVGLDGGFGYTGDQRFFTQLSLYEAYARGFQNIMGVCMWTLGDWRGANWQSAIPDFAEYMDANPTPAWSPPDTDPEPPLPSPSLEHHLWDASVAEQIRTGLRFNPDAALQRTLNVRELQIVINELAVEHDGQQYIIQAGEDASGARAREVAVYQPGKEVWAFTDPYNGSDPLEGLEILAPFKTPFVMTSPFNAPRSYANGLHEGIDLDVVGAVADSKEPVLCGYPGTVVRVDYSATGYGHFVVIRSAYKAVQLYQWYAHLDEVFVSVGTSVDVGTAIGEVGDTGNVTGEHLHYNLQVPGHGLHGYVVDDVVDPTPYVRTTPQTVTGVDMRQYFVPPGGTMYGDIIILKNNWGQGDERQQLQWQHNYSWVTKSHNWEQRRFSSGYIDLVMDTSPNDEMYYTVQGHWIPIRFFPYTSFTRTEYVQWFYKDNCAPVPERPPGFFTSDIYFAERHSSHFVVDPITGREIEFRDVVELHWVLTNGHVEEVYYFASGKGLVEWKKANGRHSWAVEVISVGQQHNNSRRVIECL